MLSALVVAVFVTLAWAGGPTDTIKAAIEEVIRILENPALKSRAKEAERRAAIRRAIDPVFDFAEAAKRALGVHWRRRSASERKEFVKLFEDLLERAYISRIEQYEGERIVYLGESVDNSYATVRTKIITKRGSEVPVDYWMLRQGNRWVIYDVSVEGVSLIANYHSQFNATIAESSYEELVKRIKAKLAQPGE